MYPKVGLRRRFLLEICGGIELEASGRVQSRKRNRLNIACRLEVWLMEGECQGTEEERKEGAKKTELREDTP